MTTESPSKPITMRTALIGLIFSVIVSLWGQYASAQMNYHYITRIQMPLCLVVPFLLLILFPNLLLRLKNASNALTTSELLTIFCMGLVSSMVPDWAMVRYLISLITAPNYFANPENQWAEHFYEFLPQWLVLPDDNGEVSDFYAGLPSGQSIPWRVWFFPLFWWLSAMGTLLFVGACLIVILRKQWVEHERLRFPMGEVVLRLMEMDEDGSSIPRLYHNRIFQTGFLITFAIMIWNCISFWEFLPRIPIPNHYTSIVIDPAFPPVNIRLAPYVLCFSFFINLEILFSVWFFQLFRIIQTGMLNRFGIISSSTSIVPGGLVSIQLCGGLIMFVLWGFWMARGHLKLVARHAFGRETELRDEDELFSYRTAVFGLIAGIAYLIAWLHAIGFTLPIAVLFLFFLYVFYIGIARVVAEAGLINLYRKTQPLFLGILVGYVLGVAVAYVVDSLWFPDRPHVVEIF